MLYEYAQFKLFYGPQQCLNFHKGPYCVGQPHPSSWKDVPLGEGVGDLLGLVVMTTLTREAREALHLPSSSLHHHHAYACTCTL